MVKVHRWLQWYIDYLCSPWNQMFPEGNMLVRIRGLGRQVCLHRLVWSGGSFCDSECSMTAWCQVFHWNCWQAAGVTVVLMIMTGEWWRGQRQLKENQLTHLAARHQYGIHRNEFMCECHEICVSNFTKAVKIGYRNRFFLFFTLLMNS